jgi:hypothetical protein
LPRPALRATAARSGAANLRPAPRTIPTPRTGPTLRATDPAHSSAIGGAPRWVSGLLAGAQAALLSAVVIVTPALAAYVATSADPANADVGWPQSVAVGAVFWLLGHGAVVQAAGATISIVPLGLTALALFAAFASARRSAHPTLGAWLAGIGGYLAVVATVVLLVGAAGPLGAGAWATARTGLGAIAVAALGLGLGLVRPGGMREITRPVWSRLHPLIRLAGAAGVLVAAVLVAAASLATVGWLVSGRAAAGDVIDGLGLGALDGVLLAGAQLALVPNLVLWVAAWVAGPGFAVGEGTVFSPTEVIAGPMPALPMLGALPTEGVQGAVIGWIPAAVIGAGAVAGWWLHRRIEARESRSGHEPFVAAAGAAVAAGAVVGLLSLLAAGSAGPGRLAVVGGAAGPVALSVSGLALVGLLVAAVPTDHVVRARFVHGCRTIAAMLRGGAVVPDGEARVSPGDEG